MGRPVSIETDDLMRILSNVFRDVGYEAASLAMLSEATGLKKASLYHRFPGGKEQMAHEVLSGAGALLSENVLVPLQGDGSPEERVRVMTRRLGEFYSGGKQACLLNLLASPLINQGPFAKEIKSIFRALIDSLKGVMIDAEIPDKIALARAERAVMLLQGSLVLSRGLGTTRPFKECLKNMSVELFGAVAE